MKHFIRFFALLIVLCGFGWCAPGIWAAQPGSNARAETKFLKSIPSRATLAQTKKLLPKSTKFGAPKLMFADVLYGNVISFKGELNGILVFLSAEQKKQAGDFSLTQQQRNNIRKYRASDSINTAWIIMDNGLIKSDAEQKQRLGAVTKYLGKPNSTEYVKDGPSFPSGLQAVWKLPRTRTIELLPGAYTNKSERGDPILLVHFSYSSFG